VPDIVRWIARGAGASLEPRREAAPGLLADEVLVEVEAAVLGPPELIAIERATGFAPGEAAVGVVVEAGAAATEQIGARVLVTPVEACGECETCRRGHPPVCPSRRRRGLDTHGALASHVVARGRWVLGLGGALAQAAPGPSAAALAREGCLAYTMFARAGVAPGEATVWIGRSPIAAMGRAIATGRSAYAISPPSDESDLRGDALASRLRARLVEAGAAAPSPWKVFECTGRDAGRRRAIGLAGPGDTLIFLANEAAGTRDDAPVELASLLALDGAVHCVAGVQPDLLVETVALAARGELDLAATTTVIDAADVDGAIASLRAGRHADRVVVVTGLRR
jgi:D-arabinose 1-dehydrogenase-like Zn-dependent alcohol dehydrogenase